MGLKEIRATGTILDGNNSGNFFRDYLIGRVEKDGLCALYKVDGIGDDQFSYRYFSGPKKETATKGIYYQGVPVSQLENPNGYKHNPMVNFYDMSGDFGVCWREGGVGFRGGKKPEKLIELILNHFSKEGDFVLDCFGGSGTTAAAAHKMRRKWITIEIGEQAITHCATRLNGVIDGKDKTGITANVSWNGGGGYCFYRIET